MKFNKNETQGRQSMGDILKKIHNASVRILKEIGIRLHNREVIELLKQNGIRVDGQTALFEEKQLMRWINKAPGRFTLYARNSDHDMFIGGDCTEYAAGYGTPTIVAPDGSRRSATLQDYITFLKLVDQSEYFNINGGILVQPYELSGIQSNPVMIYAVLTHSDKCILGMPGTTADVEHIMNMGAIVFGGKKEFIKRPHIATMISTLSPLQIDRNALQTMLVCAHHKQPLIISPAPAAGTTGPIVMAGNISLANAEALAAIAIAQIINEGTPVVYGLQSYAADMASGNISIGSPGYSIQAKYCAQLAKMYGLPSRTGGTNTDAKGVSVQSGYESMMSMLLACQNKVNLIIHSAGILDSFAATSYEQFIVDLEIISMIEYYLADIETDPEDFAFDVIREVGIGGQFITTQHTLERCRKDSWHPEIGLRGYRLKASPNEQLFANIERKMQKMLDRYEKPNLPPDILADLHAYMVRIKGVDESIIEAVHPGGDSPSRSSRRKN
jgi:trimethylamine--corrinoid protein Co-methyltransferase